MDDNAINQLMKNLARDLVEIEQTDTSEEVLKEITETYQKIYNELIEIKRE